MIFHMFTSGSQNGETKSCISTSRIASLLLIAPQVAIAGRQNSPASGFDLLVLDGTHQQQFVDATVSLRHLLCHHDICTLTVRQISVKQTHSTSQTSLIQQVQSTSPLDEAKACCAGCCMSIDHKVTPDLLRKEGKKKKTALISTGNVIAELPCYLKSRCKLVRTGKY